MDLASLDLAVNFPAFRLSYEPIFDDLAILEAVLMDPPQELVEKQLEYVKTKIISLFSSFHLEDPPQELVEEQLEHVKTKIISLFSSFHLEERMIGEAVFTDTRFDGLFELEMQLFILLMPVKEWRYKTQMIIYQRDKSYRFYYPITEQIWLVNHLVENLEELVKYKADLIGPLVRFILQLQKVFNSSLMKISELRNKDNDPRTDSDEELESANSSDQQDLRNSLNRITNLAYKVEAVIDSFFIREIPIWHCCLWLLNILNEFEQTKMETIDNPATENLTTHNIMVGFKAETNNMIDQLTRGPEKLCIISIVGMPGQGKTTFANKLYSDPLIVAHFDIRAKCCVSQVYKKRELLLELLGDFVQQSETIHHKDDVELAHMLQRSLLGRRFLILLDDLWSADAWNDLAQCFPDKNNGSRIMFTTRIQELAYQVNSHSLPQPLNPLTDDESWELLEKKLFPKQRCPLELQDVGWQIAKSCKGLPLSIILIAGILATVEEKEDLWKQFAKSASFILDAGAQGVVELSYKNLPDHLKSCFLYFGAFLEDREVPIWKLIRFWIAEGFINHVDKLSLEDVAEQYLNDLIGRSLIAVDQRRSDGGVKSCRIHDLLRDFCLARAGEENFMQLINGYDKLFPSSHGNLHDGMDPNYSYPTPIVYDLRRICIYSQRKHFIMLKPSGPLVRSLLFIAASEMNPTYSYDISFISQNFKLLRILDLEDINIGNSFKAIMVLVHLRYLAVQGLFDSIPSSIANLKNLESFLVKGLSVVAVKVPYSIWNMVKLRHFHFNNSASLDFEFPEFENSVLNNLQSFSTPSLAYGDNMEKILGRLRGIRKLKCIFLDSWDELTNCNKFPELKFLSQLVSLKVFYNGEGKYPCEFSFPSNLKRLTLSNFSMPWNEISKLTTLRNLEVLKLLNNACVGERWEMEEEVFPKLKFLKLDNSNIVTWSASDEHFPSLRHLCLYKCEQLEEIPPCIGDICTLQTIEVIWCSHSAVISAKSILEEQLEYSKELAVLIHPKL